MFGEDLIGDVLNDGSSVVAITADNMDTLSPYPSAPSSSSSSSNNIASLPALIPNDPNNNNGMTDIPSTITVPTTPLVKRENTTNFSVEYRTVEGEAKLVFDLTEENTLQELSDAIVKEEGKDAGILTTQLYTLNHPLMPIGGSEKCKNYQTIFEIIRFYHSTLSNYQQEITSSIIIISFLFPILSFPFLSFLPFL